MSELRVGFAEIKATVEDVGMGDMTDAELIYMAKQYLPELIKLLTQGREIVEEIIALSGGTMELGRYEKLNEWVKAVADEQG